MTRKTLLLFMILCSESVCNVFAADPVPVLLRVPLSEQDDTLGCNFPQQVTSLVYNEILAKHVKLWDSPSKEIQISGTTLMELEKTSDTKFTEQEVFFIYENWQKTKAGIITNTIGFTFLNKNMNGEDVSYGFVDYNDLKEIFVKNKINTNANGLYSINFATYLYKKIFNFNIIQLGAKTITTGGESENAKSAFIGNQAFNPSIELPVIPDKSIAYFIDNASASDDTIAQNSRELIKQTELYLSLNEEVFFNSGGDKLADYITKNKIKVTRIVVNEIWKKSADGIYYLPKTITIFVNDSALNTVSFKEFADFGFFINSKSISQLFNDKDFAFTITTINSQKIARKDSYLYYKALMTYNWSKLTEFVKYY